MSAPNRPTKRAAALAVSNLIDEYGSRLVIEALSDYLRRYLGLNLWADRYDAANLELDKGRSV